MTCAAFLTMAQPAQANLNNCNEPVVSAPGGGIGSGRGGV